MKTVELRTADGRAIAGRVCLACSFASRCVGLARRPAMHPQEGLLLSPGGSIHTIGMRFPIDVVFLTRQMRIVGFAARVRPWRFRRAPSGTGRVLELAAGRIAETGLALGTYVVVESGTDEARPRCTARLAGASSRPPCERLPLRFSLRLPLQHDRAPPTHGGCGVRPARPCHGSQDTERDDRGAR